jgi:Mce-associated membrane protein
VSDAPSGSLTTSAEPDEPAPSSWRRVNLLLAVVAGLLVVAIVVLAVLGLRTDPAQARAKDETKRFAAVTKAATDETVAFLTVDYKNMEPLIAKVLAGAAGDFKQQYGGAKENLENSATAALAVSTGKVRKVGVAELTGKTAVVFVAADSQVTNKGTSGKAQPRYYRLKLTMVLQSGKWLTSDLEFVG